MGTRFMRLFLYGVLVAVFLAACGGGGSQSIPSIEYNGNPAPAMINSSNAEELALAAYEGGDFGSSTVVVASTEGSGSSGVSVPVTLTRIVATEFAKKAAGGSVSALATDTSEVSGNCAVKPDGIATTILNINLSAFKYSGTMTYDNYCQEVGANIEVVINGTVTVSGTFSTDDINDPTFVTMNQNQLYHYVTMDTYDVTAGLPGTLLEPLTIAGQAAASINIDFNTSTMDISATANLGMKDNNSGKTFKVENYSISMSLDYPFGFNCSVRVSGRFYHWEHGYVNISTSTDYPILISSGAAHPYSGVIQIDAPNGSNAQLTFLNSTQYQIAGVDGNDTPFIIGPLPW